MSDNVAAQGDHYPECPTASLPHEVGLCICARLRDVEQRVEDREALTNHITQYRIGYAAGLDDAIGAVEALGVQHPRWDAFGTHYGGCWTRHPECALTLALAAIDALKGKSND